MCTSKKAKPEMSPLVTSPFPSSVSQGVRSLVPGGHKKSHYDKSVMPTVLHFFLTLVTARFYTLCLISPGLQFCFYFLAFFQ